MSIASVDRVNKAAADLGIPLPMDLKQQIEQAMPFVGGLDTAKPLGLAFIVGEGFKQQEYVAFVLPPQAGKATIADLQAKGATPEAEAGVLSIQQQLAFKRTANYLFVYPGNAARLKLVNDNIFSRDYQTPGTLISIRTSATQLRTQMPDLYKEFLTSILENSRQNRPQATAPGQALGQQIGEKGIRNWLEKADQYHLSLGLDAKNVRLTMRFLPSFLQGKREFAKPVFPAGAIATGHLVYPDAATAGWMVDLMKMMSVEDMSWDKLKLSPEQIKQARQAMESLAAVVVGDAQSFCVQSTGSGSEPTITLVNQYARQVDVLGEIKKHVTAMNTLDGTQTMQIEDWKGADGTPGIRLQEKGKKQHAIITQQGNLVVVTFTAETLTVQPKITLSPTEKISDFFTANVDVAAAATLAGMPEPMLQQLAGKSVNIRMVNDSAGGMTLDATLPVELIKLGISTAQQVMPR